jgi:hypothetical protein
MTTHTEKTETTSDDGTTSEKTTTTNTTNSEVHSGDGLPTAEDADTEKE